MYFLRHWRPFYDSARDEIVIPELNYLYVHAHFREETILNQRTIDSIVKVVKRNIIKGTQPGDKETDDYLKALVCNEKAKLPELERKMMEALAI